MLICAGTEGVEGLEILRRYCHRTPEVFSPVTACGSSMGHDAAATTDEEGDVAGAATQVKRKNTIVFWAWVRLGPGFGLVLTWFRKKGVFFRRT